MIGSTGLMLPEVLVNLAASGLQVIWVCFSVDFQNVVLRETGHCYVRIFSDYDTDGPSVRCNHCFVIHRSRPYCDVYGILSSKLITD